MRHIIQAQPPIIAAQPSTGSHQIAPDIGIQCKTLRLRAVEAMDRRSFHAKETGSATGLGGTSSRGAQTARSGVRAFTVVMTSPAHDKWWGRSDI